VHYDEASQSLVYTDITVGSDGSLKEPFVLNGTGSFVVIAFSKNVAGFTHLSIEDVSDSTQSLGITYSESSNYALCPSTGTGTDCRDGDSQQYAGDHSNGGQGPDGFLSSGPLTAGMTYTPSVDKMRGGFRYMNVFLQTEGSVTISAVWVNFTAAPTFDIPSDYANHFYSSDDSINKVWYGCAYTVQLCTIDPQHGRKWGPPASGWDNGNLIGVGKSILVDGAKRDRTIWPGDMGVSSDALFATTGDVNSSRWSLETLYGYQDPVTGMLP